MDSSLGTHPLDWFLKTDFDAASLKRKKTEQGELRSLSLLDKIVSKKNQLIEAQSSVAVVEKSAPKAPYLESPPTDGSTFYRLSSPDCFQTGYIEVLRPQNAATTRLRPKIERLIDIEAISTEDPQTSITQQKIPTDIKHDTEQLWAEKYQPRSYLELLTENEHNKVVLTWLKLWDPCVFKREKTYEFTVNDFYKSVLDVEEASPFLPKKRMLFLHGPSGCSKSTLAKICALQTGYRPVFIDASEFPNAAKFRESFSETTGNAKISFNPELRKPVCPIIENIDGASADVITCLMNEFARDKPSKKNKRNVRRPIILISSNFYSASLRKLRPSCFAVHIASLNKDRTITRLEKICALENLEIKRHLLVEMFDQCNQDLRMCLNNLQFLCSIWWKQITLSGEQNSRISEFSIFDALNNILTTNPHYKGNKLLPPRQRSKAISNMLSRRSDLDAVYHAIFYNLGITGRLRPVQKRRICGLLTDDDMINSYMRHTQSWTLLRYTNTAGILIHFCLANYTPKRLIYNLGFMKYKQKSNECAELIDTFKDNLKPRFRLSPTSLQLELLPALFTIIQPFFTLSATQLQFCDSEEMKLINRIVEVMSFYGLSYSSSFDNMALELRLEPPIDSLVTYHTSTQNTTTLNMNAKKFINQLLSRKQIETEVVQQVTDLSKDPKEVELLSDQQRVPGLALLGQRNKNVSTARGDLVYMTSTKFLYRQGNSQAIRIRVQNKHLFSFF